MDFSFTEDQKELRDSAVKFARARLNDGIIDLDSRSEFPLEKWKACAGFGLQGMLIPEKYGGLGLNALDFAHVMEGIGYGCRDNGLIFSVNAHVLACVMPVFHYGSEELKEKYLFKMASGEIIGANAMTEPDTGSDVYSLRTAAVREDDYYILNGAKTFITNAPVADAFIVYAKTDAAKGFFGISCFLVDRDTEGFRVGKKIEKMGLRTSPMSDISLIDCRVPKSNLIGREGAGGILFSDSMEWERTLILSNCLGVMDRHIEDCIKYAGVRKVGGQSIGKYQAVAHKIAEMKVRLETSRLALYRAAWLKSRKKSAALESSLAKLYASESYISNCRDAMQIFGGYGYTVEYEWERELRDAMASSIYSGTSEIQKNIISLLLL